MSSTVIQHHDTLPLARRLHAPAVEHNDPDAVLDYVAAALDSGDPDMIDDAHATLRRAMRALLDLPASTA